MTEGATSTDDVVKTYSGPGRAATHEHGVLYQGDYQHPADGMSSAIRLHARALSDQGIPVVLRPLSNMVATTSGVLEPLHVSGLDPKVREEIYDLTQTSIAVTLPVIKHLIPHSADLISRAVMRGAVGPLDSAAGLIQARAQVYGNTILYSVWERASLPAEIVRELQRVRENWVPSEQNANLLRNAGVQNVQVIPHPFNPSDKLCLLTQRPAIKQRRFYSIGKWEPRKNFPALMAAYLTAFSPSDDVSLTIKTSGSWPNYAPPSEVLAKLLTFSDVVSNGWTKENCTIRIMEGVLSRGQILKLHFENNIYVSASHGEGYGLPAFEAKVAGNRLMYVPWGGVVDFTDENDVPIHHGFEAVPVEYRWGPCRWASVSEEAIAHSFGHTHAPEVFVRTAAFENRFSMETVGRLMKARVLALSPGRYQ